MLDPRVYRAAFAPFLLAVFVVAFSLEGRPAPATTRLAADAFDVARAYGGEQVRNSLVELAAAFPERRPGSSGDAALADRVAGTLRGNGFRVSRRQDEGRTVDGTTALETVEGVRPGRSGRRIVVLAHRDALAAPGVAELSGTAALLELARIFRSRDPADPGVPGERRLIGRDLRKTLVLVSTSGGSAGAAGARAWARAQDPATVDGVLVLGDLAAAAPVRPWVVPWSNGGARPPLGWQRSVEAAVRAEVGGDPGGARATGQWARRAVPFTVGEQGEVNRAGLPGVLLQASGERGPSAGATAASSRERLEAFGRAALRAVTALDGAGRGDAGGETAPAFASETSGIVTLRNVLPDWSVRLLVLCLLLPALLAAIDACFRARRRGLSVVPWLGWIGAGALPLLGAWCWLRVLGVTGALPAPAAPVLPSASVLDTGQAIALATAALGAGLGALAWRALTRRSAAARAGSRGVRGQPAVGGGAGAGGSRPAVGGGAGAGGSRPAVGGGAGAGGPRAGMSGGSGASGALSGRDVGAGDGAAAAAAGAAAGGVAFAAWIANPYAAALLVPAAHLWLLAGMPQSRLRGIGAWAAVAAGLVAPALVAVHFMGALELGPAGLARTVLIATAGGHVSVWAALAGGVLLAAGAVAVRAVAARRRAARMAPPKRPSTRGPATYYGPGSLGGTESALRR